MLTLLIERYEFVKGENKVLANLEKHEYLQELKVWIGKYKDLTNIPHWHMEYELVYVETGAAVITMQNRTYDVIEGNVLLIHGGEVHSIAAVKESIVDIIQFSPDFLSDEIKHYKLENPIFKAERYKFNMYLGEIGSELQKKDVLYKEKTEALLSLLITDIYRNEKAYLSGKSDNSYFEKYMNLLSQIDEKYAYYRFEDAVAFTEFSNAYFSKWFHRISGMTFSNYLSYVRIGKSIEMIRKKEKRSITGIASSCGFDSIRHFNREFKRITGVTPKHLSNEFVLNGQPFMKVENQKKIPFDPTLGTSKLLSENGI